MFEFCSLGSGSSGNAALLKIGQATILIDAGISFKKIQAGLMARGKSITELDAIFLTHAHGDHARSVVRCAKASGSSLYMTRETQHILMQREDYAALREIPVTEFKKTLQLKDVRIRIYRLPHIGWHDTDDAGATVGFLFSTIDEGCRFAYFTDLGTMPEYIFTEIQNCDYYFLEANHDVRWEKVSRRPAQVIARNLSDFGHLSNEQAARILQRVIPLDKTERRTKAVMLGHISKDCNSHVLVEQAIRAAVSEDVAVAIAPENALSPVLSLSRS